jgi:hypothetical protein
MLWIAQIPVVANSQADAEDIIKDMIESYMVSGDGTPTERKRNVPVDTVKVVAFGGVKI